MKPKIAVSKCLGFASCRYNGQTIPNPYVKKLADFFDFVPVCPEVEIGLGVPRKPIRIIKKDGMLRLYQPSTERDVTEEMLTFCKDFLEGKDFDGFLLKYGSPSCGINNVRIYDQKNLNKKPGKGPGFFGGEIIGRFDVAVEDEGHMYNFTYREHFYTKVYSRFRLKQVDSIASLIEFHSRNKYLLMAYNENILRELGRLVADQKEMAFEDLIETYEKRFLEAIDKTPSFGRWINVLEHVYGGFSKKLSKDEKDFFYDLIEEYRDERIPLSTLLKIIESYAKRFNTRYILGQTILDRFPKELIEISDSGKGR